MYSNFSPLTPNLGSSGTRGVCIYVAHCIKASEVSFKATAVEHVWVRLALKGTDCLLVGCIYRSSSSNPNESILQLGYLFQQASSLSSHVAVAGGFNFPQIDWDAEVSHAPDSHYSHSFLEVIRDHFLFQHVNHPTRFRLGESQCA